MHTLKCRKGFTLVELSIVLVILGIILTTIVKGGEILRSARIKSLLLTQNDLHQAVLAYREKFGYLPGDDPLALTHVGATSSTVPSSSNGFVDDGEKKWALHHLMMAGLITGNYDGSTFMVNNFSSEISIKNVNFGTVFSPGTINYVLDDGNNTVPGITAVVYKDLPYDVAQALEVALDGPDPPTPPATPTYLTGSVRGSKNYTSANSPIPFTYCALYPVAP